MLKLSKKLTLDSETINDVDLTDRFSDDDLQSLGDWCWAGYQRDKHSRDKWERRTEAAMDLAMQIQKAKSFPWPNCSNVAFPLITISVLQYHAKAYPAIVRGTDVVRYRTVGPDPKGEQAQRAARVGGFMSWERLEEDKDWEEGQDRLLINYAVVGTAFKKSFKDNLRGYVQSELVLAKDLVLDYYAKSVEECPRKTHVIPLFRNEIYERVMTGAFRNVLEEDWYLAPITPAADDQSAKAANREGTEKPMEVDETTPLLSLEQHVSVDLDQDGYAEPYVITFEESSHAVLRIVCRFPESAIERTRDGKIICIRPVEYFTKYGFLPSPDGGIYDIGFGVLMGPLNESVNTAVNQIFDAGTMQTTGGGFLGRGVKIRGGVMTIAPNTWVRVESSGEDLQKNIVPNPVREPSAVLYQLLVLLINYSNRISGALDVTVGENLGQNTPAETSRTMLSMGMKIYNAIFKRTWRSMKEEFRKIYLLHAESMAADGKSFGEGLRILREDFLGDPDRIAPVADPNITSDELEIQKILTIKQSATGTQGYDLADLEVRFLKAMQVESIETLYPGPGKVPPLPNPKVMVEQLKLQSKQLAMQQQQQEFIIEMQEQHRLNTAKIIQLIAQAEKLKADAVGTEAGHQIAAFDAAIGALKAHDESLREHIKLATERMEAMNGQRDSEGERGGMGRLAASSGNGGAEMAPGAMATGGNGEAGGGVFH